MHRGLFKGVKLTCDLPGHQVRRVDIVKLVDRHVAPDSADGSSIEVINAVRDTIAVTTVPISALEALHDDKVLCARPFNLA